MKELVEKSYVSNQIADFGPVLSDAEFFRELDTDISELRFAAEAYVAGDVQLAYKCFSDYIRMRLNAQLYFFF